MLIVQRTEGGNQQNREVNKTESGNMWTCINDVRRKEANRILISKRRQRRPCARFDIFGRIFSEKDTFAGMRTWKTFAGGRKFSAEGS